VITRTLTPAQVKGVLARTNRVILKNSKRAILEAAALGAELVARDAPVDTGRLKQSVRLRRKGASGHPEVVADAPYAGVVEAGSRPHWAPLQPLVKWVRRHVQGAAKAAGIRVPAKVGLYKGRSARAWAAYNRRSRIRSAYVGEILAMARGVQLKIAHKGTRPTWFTRKNLPRMGKILGEMLAEAKNKSLRDLSGDGGTD
jgi:hypothetical protein